MDAVSIVIDDIRNVSDEQWRAARRNLGGSPKIGCSETALIMDIYNAAKEPHPWSTPTALANELKDARNSVLKSLETSEAMEWGHVMETPIAKEWEKQNPDWRLIGTYTMYESTKFVWMRGNLDFWVQNKQTGELRILEIKHTSKQNKSFITAMRTGLVPEYYIWQCQAEMTLMNIPKMFICLGWSAMTPGCTVEDIAWVAVDHDQAKEDFMVKASLKFLALVLHDQEIVVRNDTKAVAAEKKENRIANYVPGTVYFAGSAKAKLEEFIALQDAEAEASKNAKLLKAKKEAAGEELFQLAQQHERALLSTTELTYEFSLRFASSAIAREDKMAQLEPGVYAESLKLNDDTFKTLCRAKGLSDNEIAQFFETSKKPSGFSIKTKSTFGNPVAM